MKRTSNTRPTDSSDETAAAGSIYRAARVLACLCDNANTITEIANQSNFAKSTVHRILKLMEQSQMVTEDPSERRYYLGPLVTRLVTHPLSIHEFLIRCVMDEMKHLAKISEETVALDILFGVQIVPLYEIPTKHDIRVTDGNQRLAPLYTGASSKVLLSQLSDDRLKKALKYATIPRLTDRTVTDKQTLLSQIAEIRETGYSISRGERTPGVLCITVPIFNYTSPAALSVVGLEARFTDKEEHIIQEMKEASQRLSHKVQKIFSQNKS